MPARMISAPELILELLVANAINVEGAVKLFKFTKRLCSFLSLGGNPARKSSVPELILELLVARAVDLDGAIKYFQNYKHFENSRATIEQSHAGKFVASINQTILAEDSSESLFAAISNLPDSNRAYFEQI